MCVDVYTKCVYMCTQCVQVYTKCVYTYTHWTAKSQREQRHCANGSCTSFDTVLSEDEADGKKDKMEDPMPNRRRKHGRTRTGTKRHRSPLETSEENLHCSTGSIYRIKKNLQEFQTLLLLFRACSVRKVEQWKFLCSTEDEEFFKNKVHYVTEFTKFSIKSVWVAVTSVHLSLNFQKAGEVHRWTHSCCECPQLCVGIRAVTWWCCRDQRCGTNLSAGTGLWIWTGNRYIRGGEHVWSGAKVCGNQLYSGPPQ